MSVEAAASAAAKQLGYGALKDLQLEVIKGIATGRDMFALLQTRYGKSLCYGCLPVVFDFCIIQQNIPMGNSI